MKTKKAKHIKVGEKINIVVSHDEDGESIESFCKVYSIAMLESGPTLQKTFLVDHNNTRFWTFGFHPDQLVSYEN